MSVLLKEPENGTRIAYDKHILSVPDDPIIPYIAGDGIGLDITPAMLAVVDAAVKKSYNGQRRIHWMELPAGERSHEKYGEWLPQETIGAIRRYRVVIKGPLTTPVGGGIRSLNVALRQELDLFACVRPVRWYKGVPSPMKRPQDLNVTIFRENTEDLYLGIEFPANSEEAVKIIDLLQTLQKKRIVADSGIGIKPISKNATERICRSAIEYALAHKSKSITVMHKGNIQKYTEGAFMRWAYDFYLRQYRKQVVTEQEIWEGAEAEGRIVIKDRIADAIFQQLLLRPSEYDVIVTSNLNGDYISDAAAAQVGGLGLAPGANIGDGLGLFEATHGTAPKYARQDKVNPSSLILSAVMMLHYIDWPEAGCLIEQALETTIGQKRVTYDLERQMEGATRLSCSEFAKAIIENM